LIAKSRRSVWRTRRRRVNASTTESMRFAYFLFASKTMLKVQSVVKSGLNRNTELEVHFEASEPKPHKEASCCDNWPFNQTICILIIVNVEVERGQHSCNLRASERERERERGRVGDQRLIQLIEEYKKCRHLTHSLPI
jgi:hypothetical protein